MSGPTFLPLSSVSPLEGVQQGPSPLSFRGGSLFVIRPSQLILLSFNQTLPLVGTTPPILLPCFNLLCSSHSSYEHLKIIFMPLSSM